MPTTRDRPPDAASAAVRCASIKGFSHPYTLLCVKSFRRSPCVIARRDPATTCAEITGSSDKRTPLPLSSIAQVIVFATVRLQSLTGYRRRSRQRRAKRQPATPDARLGVASGAQAGACQHQPCPFIARINRQRTPTMVDCFAIRPTRQCQRRQSPSRMRQRQALLRCPR